MCTNFAGLGIKHDGSALTIQLMRTAGSDSTVNCIPLTDALKQGSYECAAFVGAVLIVALSALNPGRIDSMALAKITPPRPVELTFDRLAVVRPQRVALGLDDDPAGPMLVVRCYDGEQPIGEDERHSLDYLMGLDKEGARSVIGEAMLRRLAAMHPDVLPPLFPSAALDA